MKMLDQKDAAAAAFSHEYFMSQAMEEAQKALLSGEIPVGAVVVKGHKIIGRGQNQSVASHDPAGHAEIIALREAALSLQNYRLTGCDLYVTLEPCIMCLGAAVHARIKRLFFGAFDPKSGAAGTSLQFPMEKMNHRVKIKGGILESECRTILKSFFETKR